MPKKPKTKLYRVWSTMKERCYNPNHIKYKNYGARGIKVCEKWKADFKAFQKWAYENGYEEGLSIDRIDNNKGYEPNNCRWATMTQQANNRRSNRLIEIDGETHTMTEWSKISGIKVETIWARLVKYGYSNRDAVFSQKAGYPRKNSFGIREE